MGDILIFITANNEGNNFLINKNYCNAISDLGQVPILISNYKLDVIDKIISVADGILFSGGGDIHAKFFNQKLHPKVNDINFERDEFELKLCAKAIQKNLPILGICRGMQIINIAMGGNIFQHISNHMQNIPRDLPIHNVNVLYGTKLFCISKAEKIKVNSLHHQAVNVLGNEIIISAKADDGTIEAIEMPNKKFVLGVQWHPESLYKIYDVHGKIFKEFVNATLC